LAGPFLSHGLFMKLLALITSLLLLAGCAGGLAIDTSHTATGQSSRVQYVVLHYTAGNLQHSLQLLTHGEVSAHYLIGDGDRPKLYRLVDENRRAWHAGDSAWKGRTWLNASTIGIELVNPGFVMSADGRRLWQPYSEAQIELLIALLKDIQQRHQLPIDSIIGHSDVAPQRKVDPGPLFPWHRLAAAGLIRWPQAASVQQQQALFANAVPDALWFQQQLHQAGFVVPDSGLWDEATRAVLAAFQMKYRPGRHDGLPDAQSAALLAVLNRGGR
jgi:N-acetylmuramoyl-L-alanine amidase